MNPRVERVVSQANYRLCLTFTNGELRIFDARPLLDKGIFRALRDISAFQSVHVWHGTVQWNGGQDICPDTLYEESVLVETREQDRSAEGTEGLPSVQPPTRKNSPATVVRD